MTSLNSDPATPREPDLGTAIERQKLRLEERRFELESELKRRELSLREAEQTTQWNVTPAQATVAAAIIALIGGIVGGFIQSWTTSNVEERKAENLLDVERTRVRGNIDLEQRRLEAQLELEKKKFETTLILNAIDTASREEAIRNLAFFVLAGFITDADGKIIALSPDEYPTLAVKTPPLVPGFRRVLRCESAPAVVYPPHEATVSVSENHEIQECTVFVGVVTTSDFKEIRCRTVKAAIHYSSDYLVPTVTEEDGRCSVYFSSSDGDLTPGTIRRETRTLLTPRVEEDSRKIR